MKVIGVIPARFAAARFEGKVLAHIGGKPMVQHVYERSRGADMLDDLLVATDDERVAQAVRAFGGKVVMTAPEHPSGTDRIAEAVASRDVDVVVNIQGDEPFISTRSINQAAEPFRTRPDLVMSTLVRPITDAALLADTNVVKCVRDRAGYALYFSRSLIPHPRDQAAHQAYEHIGLYAYRKGFLIDYARMEPTPLERTERLEQLRALENGYRIYTAKADEHLGLSVDTPEDLERAEAYWQQNYGG